MQEIFFSRSNGQLCTFFGRVKGITSQRHKMCWKMSLTFTLALFCASSTSEVQKMIICAEIEMHNIFNSSPFSSKFQSMWFWFIIPFVFDAVVEAGVATELPSDACMCRTSHWHLVDHALGWKYRMQILCTVRELIQMSFDLKSEDKITLPPYPSI